MRERAIFFDLDNTLYCFKKIDKAGEEACVTYLKNHFDYRGTRVDYHKEIYQHMDSMMERLGHDNCGVHSRTLRNELFLKAHGWPAIPHAAKLDQLYWTEGLKHLTIEPGIKDLLEDIKEQRIYVGVGTNMSAFVQYQKIDRLGLSDFVSDIISSEEAGYEKPSSGFFAYCAAKADVDPSNAIFVGDNYENDVLGSRNAGMKGVLYNPPYLSNISAAEEAGIPIIRDYRQPEVREILELDSI